MHTQWQKSSYSAQANNCVELARSESGQSIHLRESDEPTRILTTSPTRLASLLAAARDGRLNRATGSI